MSEAKKPGDGATYEHYRGRLGNFKKWLMVCTPLRFGIRVLETLKRYLQETSHLARGTERHLRAAISWIANRSALMPIADLPVRASQAESSYRELTPPLDLSA